MTDPVPPPAPSRAGLGPLAYHLEIADRLERLEPKLWAVFRDIADRLADPAPAPGRVAATPGAPGPAAPTVPSAITRSGDAIPGDAKPLDPAPVDASAVDDLQAELLRSAYRLEPGSHPAIHAAAARAAAALGVTVPITIYQLEGVPSANASLSFRSDEATVLFSGNILALLSDDELTAAFGHELAHYRLWSTNRGRILAADRLLGALTMDAQTPPVYYETARRYDLATELYSDRGARLACGDLGVAIRSLVKVATGLAQVDDVAYLAQAEAANPRSGSRGASHPETVLRAWALSRWDPEATGDDTAAAAAVSTLLHPALDLERLDLLDADRLVEVTRTLVTDALAGGEWLRTEAVLAHARQFLDERPAGDRPASPTASGPNAGMPNGLEVTPIPGEASTETRRYLAYVLLDLASVDPDLEDTALVELLVIARRAGIGPIFETVARKELGLTERAFRKLTASAATREAERHAGATAAAAAPVGPEVVS